MIYDLSPHDRMLLRAIGSEGKPFRTIRKLTGADLPVLDRLCDLGYIWVCDPDDGPLLYLSEHGRDALEAENASGQAAAPDNDEAAASGAGADPAETTAHQTAVSLALTTLELIV